MSVSVSPTHTCDVLIVGSGPVGSTFARVLRQLVPDIKVMMLEAGGPLSRRPGENIRNLPAGQRPPRAAATSPIARPEQLLDMPGAAMSENVGGMAAHWTCAVPDPDPSERPSFVPSHEYAESLDTAKTLLSYSAAPFPPDSLADWVQRRLTSSLATEQSPQRSVRTMPMACVPTDDGLCWTGPWSILEPVLGRFRTTGDRMDSSDGRFTLLSRTLCRRIAVGDDRAGRAEAVYLPTGERLRFSAEAVVVAGDSFRTPQLLWASGIRPDALGRYLNVHPLIAGRVIPERPGGARHLDVLPKWSGADDLNHLRGSFWVPYDPETHPFSGQVMLFQAPEAERSGEPQLAVHLGWLCASRPEAENRITFSDDSTDRHGLPALSIRHRGSPETDVNIAKALELVRRIGQGIGSWYAGEEPRVLRAGSSLHYQGTFRMGADSNESVCDSYSRVWSTPRVMVGGNGVLPTATAANPTLSTVTLAVRSATKLAEDLNRPGVGF